MAKPRSSTVVFASIDPSRLKSMSDEAASSRACVAARRSMHPRPQAGQAEAERRGVAEERPWRETTALSELWPRPVPAGATPRRPGCGGDAVGGPPSSQAVSLDPTSCVRLIAPEHQAAVVTSVVITAQRGQFVRLARRRCGRRVACGGGRAGVDTELVEDALEMRTHGVRRKLEELRDLPVRLAVVDPAEDLRFAVGEPESVLGRASECGIAFDSNQMWSQEFKHPSVALGVRAATALEEDNARTPGRGGQPQPQPVVDSEGPPDVRIEPESAELASADEVRQPQHSRLARAQRVAKRVFVIPTFARRDDLRGDRLADDLDPCDEIASARNVDFLVAGEGI